MPFDNQYEAKKDVREILIVDAHPILRQGLINLITQNTEFIVCGEAENAHKALEFIKTLSPDMVIVGIPLEGLSGIELIERIKLQYPELPVLVFSGLDERIYAKRVFQAGAKGYIMKYEAPEKVLEAIRQVMLKGIYVSNSVAEKIMNKSVGVQSIDGNFLIEFLSNRELEVFRLIGQGYGTRRIAEELCLSVKTVEAYRGRIKNKLNIKSITKLAHYAFQWVQNENLND